MEWQELPEVQDCCIVRYRPGVDIQYQSNWELAHRWLKQEAELLHERFSPCIKALPVLDSPAEENAAEEFPGEDKTDDLWQNGCWRLGGSAGITTLPRHKRDSSICGEPPVTQV